MMENDEINAREILMLKEKLAEVSEKAYLNKQKHKQVEESCFNI